MKNSLQIVYQDETSECSLACMTMICNFYGANTSISKLRERFPIPTEGITVRNLVNTCGQLNFGVDVLKSELEGLATFKQPVLLHWDMQHFVVLKGVKNGKYIVYDPARGIRKLSAQSVSNHFTGIVVKAIPNENFKPLNDKKHVGLFDVVQDYGKYLKSILTVFILSLSLELFLLMQPFVFRQAIDELGPERQFDLQSSALILALVSVSLVISTYIRDKYVLNIASNVNFEITTDSFQKMLELPLDFFERRQIGQIIERYRVIDEIQNFFTSTVPTTIIDGFITLLTITLLFYLSPVVALLGCLTVLAYLAVKLYFKDKLIAGEIELMLASGSSSGHVIESLKSIFTIKTHGMESTRFNIWTNLFKSKIEADYNHTDLENRLNASKVFITSLNTAGLMITCAILYQQSIISLGLIFAILLYNSHFVFRSIQLVDKFIALLVLNKKVSRIEDILFNTAESYAYGKRPFQGLQKELSLKDLKFQFAFSNEELLKSASISLKKGGFYVLTGRNGTGKTTFIRLLLGLHKPVAGEILYDGVPLSNFDIQSLRNKVGCVTQDEHLFHGTILENITMFHPDPDLNRVVEVCNLVGVTEKVESLAMGFNTQIGDICTPLSEGEQQKLCIARALYKSPDIIIMDEGTANLDAESEHQIASALAKLDSTKIFIAHRPAVLDYADAEIKIHQGNVDVLPLKNNLNRVVSNG